MQIYHEKQSKRLCGLHSINNLLQYKAYDQSQMDLICEDLTNKKYFNPHRGWGGFYDINVIEEALKRKKLLIKWHDNRKQIKIDIKLDDYDDMIIWQNEKLHGILVNQTYKKFFNLFTKHHWFTILKVNENEYQNLDSKNSKQEEYNLDKLIIKLNQVIKENGHVIYVLKK